MGSDIVIYYRGTLAQFNAWEETCRISEGIPLDGSGKVNMVDGAAAPDNQKTIRYSECIVNPNDVNDVIWTGVKYPPENVQQITKEEAIAIGFITDNEI